MGLTGNITLGQSGPGSNDNKSSKIEASISDAA